MERISEKQRICITDQRLSRYAFYKKGQTEMMLAISFDYVMCDNFTQNEVVIGKNDTLAPYLAVSYSNSFVL